MSYTCKKHNPPNHHGSGSSATSKLAPKAHAGWVRNQLYITAESVQFLCSVFWHQELLRHSQHQLGSTTLSWHGVERCRQTCKQQCKHIEAQTALQAVHLRSTSIYSSNCKVGPRCRLQPCQELSATEALLIYGSNNHSCARSIKIFK